MSERDEELAIAMAFKQWHEDEDSDCEFNYTPEVDEDLAQEQAISMLIEDWERKYDEDAATFSPLMDAIVYGVLSGAITKEVD